MRMGQRVLQCGYVLDTVCENPSVSFEEHTECQCLDDPLRHWSFSATVRGNEYCSDTQQRNWATRKGRTTFVIIVLRDLPTEVSSSSLHENERKVSRLGDGLDIKEYTKSVETI